MKQSSLPSQFMGTTLQQWYRVNYSQVIAATKIRVRGVKPIVWSLKPVMSYPTPIMTDSMTWVTWSVDHINIRS